MESKGLARNIIKVGISNLFTILSGIIVGFVIPKIMGLEDYGYYKTFTLYVSYVGLFHLGFIDGICLKYGGVSYDDFDKSRFRMYSRFIIFFEFIITILVALFSMIFLGSEYFFIFIAVGLCLFGKNITSYFQFISQITGRFNELSIRNIINSILTILSVLVLFLLYRYTSLDLIDYHLYTIITIVITYLLLIWYLFTYREIIFGNHDSFDKKEVLGLIKLGFPLLFANLISSLVLNMDRQFVSLLYDPETYAIYAFAYNMLGLVTTAIAAVSTVLYPSLKAKETEGTAKINYQKIKSTLLIVVMISLVGYFVLVPIIHWFLPKYIESLPIFRIIFPTLAIQSAVTIVMSNYYKTFNMVKRFFVISLFAFVFSIILNILAYSLFHTPIAISMASVLVMLFWYLLSEYFLVKRFHVGFVKDLLYVLFGSAFFYGFSLLNNTIIGALLYLSLILALTICLYYQSIKNMFLGFRRNN